MAVIVLIHKIIMMAKAAQEMFLIHKNAVSADIILSSYELDQKIAQ